MTEQSVLLLEAGTTPFRALLRVKRMGDGDGERDGKVCALLL